MHCFEIHDARQVLDINMNSTTMVFVSCEDSMQRPVSPIQLVLKNSNGIWMLNEYTMLEKNSKASPCQVTVDDAIEVCICYIQSVKLFIDRQPIRPVNFHPTTDDH
jgi:hypothetical protein